MMNKEYCRYIHTYSELEGLQHAHSLVYCGALSAQGVVMELRHEQDGQARQGKGRSGDDQLCLLCAQAPYSL